MQSVLHVPCHESQILAPTPCFNPFPHLPASMFPSDQPSVLAIFEVPCMSRRPYYICLQRALPLNHPFSVVFTQVPDPILTRPASKIG